MELKAIPEIKTEEEARQTAKEILNYCCNYLGTYKTLNQFKKTKLYKEMLKEICFMIENN